jgi:hydroxypyruvate isomerase
MKFAVNCSILFTELPLLERPAAARKAGFEAVEFWWPFDVAVPAAAEVDAFVRAVDEAGVALIGLNFFAGDMAAGERGVLSDPARVEEFRSSVGVLTAIADRTGCAAFNALYGQRLRGVDPGEQDEVALANLRYAADAVPGTVLIESLAEGLNGAYPLRTAVDAVGVADQAGAPNVKFLFDSFHLASNGEDLGAVVAAHADRIGHVQVADVPGRGRPGTGGLDFGVLFAVLAEHGYHGWVACEYKAQGPAEREFDWIKEYTS